MIILDLIGETMQNTAETDFNTPVQTLSELQLSRLKQAVKGLNTGQLTWSRIGRSP